MCAVWKSKSLSWRGQYWSITKKRIPKQLFIIWRFMWPLILRELLEIHTAIVNAFKANILSIPILVAEKWLNVVIIKCIKTILYLQDLKMWGSFSLIHIECLFESMVLIFLVVASLLFWYSIHHCKDKMLHLRN